MMCSYCSVSCVLSCIWLYDALHSRPRSNCIDLHGICLVYAVRYTSTHFCGMLVLAKSGCIGAMLPNYQDVLCLLAPQRSTTHRTRNTFKMMTNAQKCHPIHKKSVAAELAGQVRSCCHQHFPLLQLFPPPCRLLGWQPKSLERKTWPCWLFLRPRNVSIIMDMNYMGMDLESDLDLDGATTKWTVRTSDTTPWPGFPRPLVFWLDMIVVHDSVFSYTMRSAWCPGQYKYLPLPS